MSGPTPDANWLAALHAAADQPPRNPRVPLWAGDARIGSVEPDVLLGLALPERLVTQATCGAESGFQVHGELTTSLHNIALAMREAGPANQDGEVAQFRLMQAGEVLSRLERDDFTIEAALVITKHGL